ncbi:MAG: hypothetical protein PHO37_18380 [Kiritimatiellae bacterium]|nr:hypothetical protein [Kiritimatiellia bacterium]
MKMISLPKLFVVGLSASLHEAELSLHRADSLDELKKYYTSEKVNQIIGAIDSLNRILRNKSPQDKLSNPPTILMKIFSCIVAYIAWFVFAASILPKSTISKACFALTEFLRILQENDNVYEQKKNDFRIILDQSLQEIIVYLPCSSLKTSIRNVNHLNQAYHLTGLKDIDAVAGEYWYEIQD